MPARKSPRDYADEVPEDQRTKPVGNGMAWNHITFARHFFQTGDKVAAVRAAGSKSKNPANIASLWLHRDDVKRYLLSLHEEVRDNAVRTNAQLVEEAHRLFDEGVRLARDGDPMVGKNGSVIVDANGEIVRKANVMALLKAGELKGRAAAMFTEVHRNEGEMASMGDEELTAFLVGAVHGNPALCKVMAAIEGVQREVHAADERARSGEGDEGDSAAEAESVSPASEAGRVSEGRLH